MAKVEVVFYHEGEAVFAEMDVDWVSGVTGRSPDSFEIGSGFDINGTYYRITHIR